MTKDIQKGQEIVLKNGNIILRAWADEGKRIGAGESSAFKVAIQLQKDGPFPGVFEMTVNLNHWKVYANEDPELTEVLLNSFLPREY